MEDLEVVVVVGVVDQSVERKSDLHEILQFLECPSEVVEVLLLEDPAYLASPVDVG